MTAERSGEFRGKTIEAAISAGLASLRLSRDEVEIEVVRPGSRGVLGIGAEDAVVRLTESAEPAARSFRAEPPARVEPQPTSRPAARPEPTPSPAVQIEPAAKAEMPPKPQPRQQPAPAPAASKGEEKAMAGAQLGREFLAGLLQRMGLQATIEIVPQSDAEADDDDRIQVLNIVGDDLGVLIGRQNETLSALEFVTRLMVNQQSHLRSGFIIDVNGYRAKRAESLRKLALRSAEQVMQSGRTMALEPMPPAERRIVHLALRDHPKVYTQSVGEGDRRKVTIMLRKE